MVSICTSLWSNNFIANMFLARLLSVWTGCNLVLNCSIPRPLQLTVLQVLVFFMQVHYYNYCIAMMMYTSCQYKEFIKSFFINVFTIAPDWSKLISHEARCVVFPVYILKSKIYSVSTSHKIKNLIPNRWHLVIINYLNESQPFHSTKFSSIKRFWSGTIADLKLFVISCNTILILNKQLFGTWLLLLQKWIQHKSI